MNPTLHQLSPAIGAEIKGIDLSVELKPEQYNWIKNALHQHQVLFFRQQNIEPLAQRRLAQGFGDLHIHPIYPQIENVPEVLILDNQRNDLADNAIWHTDVTFIQTPPLGAVLAAKKVPPVGGDTLWSSSFAAWQALSPQLQTLLDGLTATHDFTRSFPVERYGSSPEELEKWDKARRANPPVSHPVVRTHPATGRKGLFVNQGFTSKINELPHHESKALLHFLFTHIARPEFTVRWRWQVGDVAFWDNRSTQHYATDDYNDGNTHRVMHRATILGDKPF